MQNWMWDCLTFLWKKIICNTHLLDWILVLFFRAMKASDRKNLSLLKNEGRVCLSAETSGFSCWLKCEGGNPREGAAGEITWGGHCGQLLCLLNVSSEPWNFSYAWSGFNNSLCGIIGNWLRKWVWDIKSGKKEFLGRVLVETWAFSVTYFWTGALCSDCSTTIFCSDSLKCWDLSYLGT